MDGALNVSRFEQLRALRLAKVVSWDVLSSLPASLEELDVRLAQEGRSKRNFEISKFPPGLRACKLQGQGLTLVLDGMAPATLENLTLLLFRPSVTPENFIRHFHTKSLRVLTTNMFQYLPPNKPPYWPHLPNLELLHPNMLTMDELPTCDNLPRKLRALTLLVEDLNASLSLNGLPPSLERLQCSISSGKDLMQLPKTLKTLNLFLPRKVSLTGVPLLSASMWSLLPPHLTSLGVNLLFFESEACLHVLPKTLEELQFHISSEPRVWDMLRNLSFPKTLQSSLRTLEIWSDLQTEAHEAEILQSLILKLSSFSRLATLQIGPKILIRSDTLSNLPKTLTELLLHETHVENFGLPLGQDPKDANWNDAAFSRLPESLVSLRFSLDTFHEEIFSKLPSKLAFLRVDAASERKFSPRRIISLLPPRIAGLVLFLQWKLEDSLPQEDVVMWNRQLPAAIDEYYSDPFWHEKS